MKRNKKMKRLIICILIICIAVATIFLIKKDNLVESISIKAKTGKSSLINDGIVSDTLVIPDKYNTGIDDISKLTKITTSGVYNDFSLKVSSSDLTANWTYTNEQGKDYVLEYYDFTNFNLRTYSSEIVTQSTTVTFNNCAFGVLKCSEEKAENIKYIFNNCTFYHVASGSNMEFNNCRFEATVGDCTNAFVNVDYNNCLLTEIPAYSTTGAHLDGIQLYGRENIKVEDVHMNNCRIIAPAIEPEGSTSYVNACIMLKLDYNDADNVTFENMHINGGGYTMYSQPMTFTMTNISFKNITIGCSYRYGPLYKASLADHDYGWNGATHENIELATNLYVGSVWKEGNSVHLSVTNDTNEEKTLKVLLSDGTSKQYTIPKCPLYSEFTSATTYDSFPFDKEIVIDEVDTDYIQCYDSDSLIRTQVLSTGTVEEKTLQSIEIKTNPTKLEYIQDTEQLDLTGGKITATYSDNSTQDIDITSDMVSGFNNSTVGNKTITVTYNGKQTTFNINIVAKTVEEVTLQSIEMKTNPTKLEYIQDTEQLDLTGAKITATYSDNSTQDIDITSDMVSGFNNSTVGNKTITVTYNGKQTTFNINIVAKTVEEVTLQSIEMKTNPTKLEYIQDTEQLDLTGAKITATYSDNSTQDIDITSDMVSGFNNSTVGNKTITVTYNGKQTTFIINIIKKNTEEKNIVKIEMKTNPTKEEYIQNKDNFDVNGGIILATYSDDSTQEIKLASSMTTGFDNSKIGENIITVEYEGVTTTFTVNIIEDEEADEPTDNNTTNNTINNNTTNSSTNNIIGNTTNNKIASQNMATGILPNAGERNFYVIIAIVIAIIGIGVFRYKYKKYDF